MTMKQKFPPVPPGVVLILSSPDGRVLATAVDFIQEARGGCSLAEGQVSRATRALALQLVRDSCATWIVTALDGYQCERIVRHMVDEQGWRLTIQEIEHASPHQD
jgi:hypothetical protein